MALVKGTKTSNVGIGATGSPAVGTLSHNSNTGTDRLLVVVVAFPSSVSTVSVEYNGVSCTQAGSTYTSPGSLRYEIWYLDEPDTGANDIDVEMSSVSTIGIMGVTFTGAGDSITNIDHNAAANTPHDNTLTISDQSMVMGIGGSQFSFDSSAAITIDGTGFGFASCDINGAVSSAQFCAHVRDANLSSGSKTVTTDTIADSFQATNTIVEIPEGAAPPAGRRRIIIV
jgi:hypothetical protein